MKIIKRNDTEVINGSCGKIQEMFDSDKLSIAYVDVTKDFVPHMHKEMEEIYYILEGSGILIVGDDTIEVSCFSPSDKKGKKYVLYWLNITKFEECKDA